jgi:hypothetical protein
MSCRQKFKDYNILTLSRLCILEVICIIKNIKILKNMGIHNHNMQKKLNLHVQHCNTVNMGISLYNKVPDQIKLRKNLNLFKNYLNPFY